MELSYKTRSTHLILIHVHRVPPLRNAAIVDRGAGCCASNEPWEDPAEEPPQEPPQAATLILG